MRQALPASSKINTKFFYNPMQPSEAVQLGAVTEACSSKAKIFADSAPAATAVKAGCQAGRLRITKNKQIFPGCVRPGHLQLSGPKVLQTLHLQQFSILAPAQLHLAALPQLFSCTDTQYHL